MSGEYQADVQLPQAGEDEPCPRQPLVEVVDDDGVARKVLDELQQQTSRTPFNPFLAERSALLQC